MYIGNAFASIVTAALICGPHWAAEAQSQPGNECASRITLKTIRTLPAEGGGTPSLQFALVNQGSSPCSTVMAISVEDGSGALTTTFSTPISLEAYEEVLFKFAGDAKQSEGECYAVSAQVQGRLLKKERFCPSKE